MARGYSSHRSGLIVDQVAFANAIVATGGDLTDASFIASITEEGQELLRSPVVQMLISARQDAVAAAIARATTWSIARVIGELDRTYESALASGQHGAAVRALELIGREMGMFAQRVDVRQIEAAALDAGIPADVLIARARQIEARAVRAERRERQGVIEAIGGADSSGAATSPEASP